MRHCIAAYWPDCRDRGTRVFSLWHSGERATADYRFDPSALVFDARDLRGALNAQPGPGMRVWAQTLGRALNAPDRAPVRAALADSLVWGTASRDGADDDDLPARLDAQSEAELARVLKQVFGPDLEAQVRLRACVAGYAHGEGPALEQRMAPGDALALVREPEHPRDALAVALHWQGQRIGYVPRGFNRDIAAQLDLRQGDQGQALRARILRIDHQAPLWRRVEFELYASVVVQDAAY